MFFISKLFIYYNIGEFKETEGGFCHQRFQGMLNIPKRSLMLLPGICIFREVVETAVEPIRARGGLGRGGVFRSLAWGAVDVGGASPLGEDFGVAAEFRHDLIHVGGIDRAVTVHIAHLLLGIGESGSVTEIPGNEGDIANGGDAVVIEIAELGSLLRPEWKAQ